MININYTDTKIEVIGHSDKKACAIISTIIKTTIAYFYDSDIIKDYKISYGYSMIEFKDKDSIIFLKLKIIMANLEKDFFNDIQIGEVNEF